MEKIIFANFTIYECSDATFPPQKYHDSILIVKEWNDFEVQWFFVYPPLYLV